MLQDGETLGALGRLLRSWQLDTRLDDLGVQRLTPCIGQANGRGIAIHARALCVEAIGQVGIDSIHEHLFHADKGESQVKGMLDAVDLAAPENVLGDWLARTFQDGHVELFPRDRVGHGKERSFIGKLGRLIDIRGKEALEDGKEHHDLVHDSLFQVEILF